MGLQELIFIVIIASIAGYALRSLFQLLRKIISGQRLKDQVEIL
jgi:hypothetical protein